VKCSVISVEVSWAICFAGIVYCQSWWIMVRSKMKCWTGFMRSRIGHKPSKKGQLTATEVSSKKDCGTKKRDAVSKRKSGDSKKLRKAHQKKSLDPGLDSLSERQGTLSNRTLDQCREFVTAEQLLEQEKAEAVSRRFERNPILSETTKNAVLKVIKTEDFMPKEEKPTFAPGPLAVTETAPRPTFESSMVNAATTLNKQIERILNTALLSHGDRKYETSLQKQKRWLAAAKKAIHKAIVAEVLCAKPPLPLPTTSLKHRLSQQSRQKAKTSHYVAFAEDRNKEFTVAPPPPITSFSTCEDDEESVSVSSVVLLFNCLSCNAVPDKKMQINHEGKLLLAYTASSSASEDSTDVDSGIIDQDTRKHMSSMYTPAS